MFQDSLATFATAQSGTTSQAGTDTIDTLAAGNDYAGTWFQVDISTAFVVGSNGGGEPTATFQLQTSDQTDFSGANTITMTQSAAFTAAQLVINKTWSVRMPPNAKRYIRAYVVQTSGNTQRFSAGAWSMYMVKDIDLEINKRHQL